MKALTLLSLLVVSFSLSAQETVSVPSVQDVNSAKRGFIQEVSQVSKKLYGSKAKNAIAPFGGTKITPILELDLEQLVIVTDSYPGTPAEIKNQFGIGAYNLKRVLEGALRNGSMSTVDVQDVNVGAQILARLNLELGVKKVTMKYWSDDSILFSQGFNSFRERKFSPNDKSVATTFDFEYKGRKTQVVLVSSYIHGDSKGDSAGIPDFVRHFSPRDGFDWAYLSADGLGLFSANPKNGFSQANLDLLNLVRTRGSILLDYPTDNAYHTPQIFGNVRFMEGRRDLSEIPDLKWIKSIRVERPGIFGYCLKVGDEVRVYQKIFSNKALTNVRLDPLKQVGTEVTWTLR